MAWLDDESLSPCCPITGVERTTHTPMRPTLELTETAARWVEGSSTRCTRPRLTATASGLRATAPTPGASSERHRRSTAWPGSSACRGGSRFNASADTRRRFWPATSRASRCRRCAPAATELRTHRLGALGSRRVPARARAGARGWRPLRQGHQEARGPTGNRAATRVARCIRALTALGRRPLQGPPLVSPARPPRAASPFTWPSGFAARQSRADTGPPAQPNPAHHSWGPRRMTRPAVWGRVARLAGCRLEAPDGAYEGWRPGERDAASGAQREPMLYGNGLPF